MSSAKTIRRRPEDRKPPEGMIVVEGVAFSVGRNPRPDIVEEVIRRRYFWRKEKLGV